MSRLSLLRCSGYIISLLNDLSIATSSQSRIAQYSLKEHSQWHTITFMTRTAELSRLNAQPGPDRRSIPARTAVIVVDMQNDFGAKGGMLDRLGIDISVIQRAIGPTAKVLAAARQAGIRIIYLKMGFRPDLSDLGAPDSLQPACATCGWASERPCVPLTGQKVAF